MNLAFKLEERRKESIKTSGQFNGILEALV
ncbi:hypothetical protein ABIE66_002261 [Peribacillus sp. B2I2]